MSDVTVYDKAWAKRITVRIRKAGEDFGSLLLEAHDGKAWKLEGYLSWTAYVAAEFAFTRQHSYRLLTQQRMNKRLAEAGSQVRVTGREAREVSPAGDRSAIEQAVADRRGGPLPKPTGKRRGFQPPDEQVRRHVEQYQGWLEQMEPGYPVVPSFVRVLERLRDTLDQMIEKAQTPAGTEEPEWTAS